MRVWIDLSNSPHPLMFAPIARTLHNEGYEVLITARDNAQTVELANERWPDVTVIGGASPSGRRAKATAINRRILELRRWALGVRPDVALSHNSYAQIVAARMTRIPAVTGMDFEHQPANHLAFRLATTVLVPEAFSQRELQRQGGRDSKVIRYPGLKEELYVGDFEPDLTILSKLGVHERPRTLVVLRTPPTRAIYHPADNPLFERALHAVCAHEDALCVMLARHPEQIATIKALGLKNCLIPRTAIDSRSLMYVADALIGAGGTMTREAALMGIPTWTVFAGTTPAVDVWLERQGRLSRLTDADQLAELGPRSAEPQSPAELRERGLAIERVFVSATRATSAGRRRRRPMPASA